LEVARENLVGGLILSMESASARMGRLARNELYFGRQRSIEETLAGIEKVTGPMVRAMARKIFRPDLALVGVLGKGSAVKGLDLGILAGK
jgi:predicted Zn-dependent peptidase